uniref:Uncharacterized protein n=1 Tax=Megaselia scalaris TaxID=36166 RepID=T1GME6_MEGSC
MSHLVFQFLIIKRLTEVREGDGKDISLVVRIVIYIQ